MSTSLIYVEFKRLILNFTKMCSLRVDRNSTCQFFPGALNYQTMRSAVFLVLEYIFSFCILVRHVDCCCVLFKPKKKGKKNIEIRTVSKRIKYVFVTHVTLIIQYFFLNIHMVCTVNLYYSYYLGWSIYFKSRYLDRFTHTDKNIL